MGRYEQSLVRSDELKEVAEFIWRSTADRGTRTAAEILRRLEWRSVLNPAMSASVPAGICLRGEDGGIKGAIMVFPQLFRLAGGSLLGLSMTDYYVVPEARPSGLMRSVLDLASADFFFSTTANAAGGGAMRKLGAVPVPGWDSELTLPLRLGPLLEGFTRRWEIPGWMRHAAERMGDLGDSVRPKPWRAPSDLRLRRTTEWALLAAIAEQVREPTIVTPRRSAEDLCWRFESAPSADCIEVFLLERGEAQGWVATLSHMRGSRKSIRCRVILDHVLSADIEPAEALRALARKTVDDTDMITIAGPEEYWTAAGSLKLFGRRLAVPKAFVIGTNGGRSLGEMIELTPAIGDNFT